MRPWGEVHWLWPHLGTKPWSFIGCVGPEDRCIAAWRYLVSQQKDVQELILEIVDPLSRHSEKTGVITAQRRNDLDNDLSAKHGVKKLDLLCRIEEVLDEIDQFILRSNGRIMLDISSFPKRILFPILKRIWNNDSVEDLVACYTIPESYGTELSEDPLPWDTIPTFADEGYPEQEIGMVIVGVGYIPLGLNDILRTELAQAEIYSILPVPPFSNRNWSFLKNIEAGLPRGEHRVVREPIRVAAHNMPEAFDHLMGLTNSGQHPALLAPYGPKTVSLSFAIFAILTGFSVYYTQPMAYSPYYSFGIKKNENGSDMILAYVLRSHNNNWYKLGT